MSTIQDVQRFFSQPGGAAILDTIFVNEWRDMLAFVLRYAQSVHAAAECSPLNEGRRTVLSRNDAVEERRTVWRACGHGYSTSDRASARGEPNGAAGS